MKPSEIPMRRCFDFRLAGVTRLELRRGGAARVRSEVLQASASAGPRPEAPGQARQAEGRLLSSVNLYPGVERGRF